MSRTAAVLIGMVILCAARLHALQVPDTQRLAIAEKDGSYELVVPVSRLVLTIPKGQLVISKGSAESPRYFLREDPGKGLIVSGWFEPDLIFKGMEPFWAGERQSLTKQGLELLNVVQERLGSWQVVFYDVALPKGRSSHVRAEWLQAGTWIDLHVSVTGDQNEAQGRQTLRDVLGAMQVAEKK